MPIQAQGAKLFQTPKYIQRVCLVVVDSSFPPSICFWLYIPCPALRRDGFYTQFTASHPFDIFTEKIRTRTTVRLSNELQFYFAYLADPSWFTCFFDCLVRSFAWSSPKHIKKVLLLLASSLGCISGHSFPTAYRLVLPLFRRDAFQDPSTPGPLNSSRPVLHWAPIEPIVVSECNVSNCRRRQSRELLRIRFTDREIGRLVLEHIWRSVVRLHLCWDDRQWACHGRLQNATCQY